MLVKAPMTRRAFLHHSPLLAAGALDGAGLAEAAGMIEDFVRQGKLLAASLLVERGGERFEKVFGDATPEKPFLIASITKPMTACGVMKLVDLGKLGYEDTASRYLPGFDHGGRERITIRHLLTHTSGLPDMLPENVELRRRHAPLSEFVAAALRTPLLFPPGTKTSYQSMGILLAAEIAARVSGSPFPAWLEKEIFLPLGMRRTALGLGRFRLAGVVPSQTEHAEPTYGGQRGATSWDWHSPYWRNLAAPWGGAHSTSRDIARLLGFFLKPSGGPLKPETAALMITDQNKGLNQPYGIGWALRRGFGSACSPGTFGHSGSTGTLCWADPERDSLFVLLTSLPARVSSKALILPVSDLASKAIQEPG
jgi:beta-lactamase class C